MVLLKAKFIFYIIFWPPRTYDTYDIGHFRTVSVIKNKIMWAITSRKLVCSIFLDPWWWIFLAFFLFLREKKSCETFFHRLNKQTSPMFWSQFIKKVTSNAGLLLIINYLKKKKKTNFSTTQHNASSFIYLYILLHISHCISSLKYFDALHEIGSNKCQTNRLRK